MRYLRRKIACILAVIMILPLTSFAGAEEAGESLQTQEKIQTQEFIFLNELGMVDSEMTEMSGSDVMTRAEFVGVLAKLSGYTDYPVPKENRFIDVISNSKYEKEIYYLRDMGVISGVDDYRFMPDAHITLEQACAAATTVLGYKRVAVNEYGGYSDGYIYMAARAGLIDTNTQKDHPLTMEEGMKLLKNTALALVYVEKKDGNSIRYETEKGRTLIAEYCDIWEGEGIVTDNGITALDGDTKAGNLHMTIGGYTLSYDGSIEMSEKIGRYVKYYYYGDEEQLIYIEDKTDKNDIVYIEADDLCIERDDFGASQIIYYEGNKTVSAKLSVNADMIYNGTAFPGFGKDTLSIKSGSLTLISNDSDSTYDVIIAEEYKNIVVRSVDTNNGIVYGVNGVSIDISKYEHVTIYNNINEQAGIEDINVNNVVSYMSSMDERNLIINISTKTISGKIDNIGVDVNEYYEVNGERYKIAYSLLEDIDNNLAGAVLPEIGKSYLLRLDKDGRIAAVESVYGNTWRYAYYVGMYTEDVNPDDGPVFRLVMTDGTVYDAYTAEKVSVNGERIKSTALIGNPLFYNGLGHKRQLVKVRLNGDGDINSVETALTEINDYGYDLENFSMDGNLNGVRWYGNNTCVMGKYAIASDAVIFEDPYKDDNNVGLSTEDIKVLKTSELREGIRYNGVDIYDADETLTASAAVYKDKGESYEPALFTISSVIEYVDENDEVKKAARGIYSGNEVEYGEYEEGVFPDDLKMGDVTRVELSGTKIKKMEKMISLADHPEPQIQVKIGNSLYESEWSNMFGYVYAKSNNALSLFNGDNSSYGKISNISLNGGAGKVTIYDVQNENVYSGTMSDIVPSGTISSNGSFSINEDTMLFVYRRYEYLKEAVLVKY